MIEPAQLNNLDNIDTVELLYDELMLHGVKAIRVSDTQIQGKVYAKLCNSLIRKYVEWNDYVHSNNILQLYKDTVILSENVKKPSWLIRYEIIICGKRTPLFFIDYPQELFGRIDEILSRNKEIQTAKMIGAVKDLFNYYGSRFLSEKALPEDKKIMIAHLQKYFLNWYERIDITKYPTPIIKTLEDIVKYAKNPTEYIEPGISIKEATTWDEDDEIAECETVNEEDFESFANEQPIIESTEKGNNGLAGKTIKFIGDIKNSLIRYIHFLEKTYEFEADITSDYDKITNLDFRKFRYSNKISAIIAGPMPHSTKGKGSYSSGLEMIKNEPGYPPVFECVTSDKLKITKESIRNALKQLNDSLMAN
jgi:hypothetical protein